MNYTGPKVKLSRSLGIALTQKAVKYMEKRPYPPGEHGASKKGRKRSTYGEQLLEKQRLRFQYNISEKQMKNYFDKASSKKGNIVDNFAQLLERRLDAVVYRAGLARSIYASRQLVSHNHILVNNKRVNLPSYQVKANDIISIKEQSRSNKNFQEGVLYSPPAPIYIETSKENMTATFRYIPSRSEIPVICEFSTIIEYYSR